MFIHIQLSNYVVFIQYHIMKDFSIPDNKNSIYDVLKTTNIFYRRTGGMNPSLTKPSTDLRDVEGAVPYITLTTASVYAIL